MRIRRALLACAAPLALLAASCGSPGSAPEEVTVTQTSPGSGAQADAGDEPEVTTFDPDDCNVEAPDVSHEGDLTVDRDSTCVLTDSEISGDISVAAGGVLRLVDTSVDGTVKGSDFADVEIAGGDVDGNVELSNGRHILIEDARIDGNVQLRGNSGDIRIMDSSIDGNLQCGGNAESPTGSGNTVGGDRDGQCSGQ